MPSLKKDVIVQTLDEVKVVYLYKEASMWWNRRRSAEDTATFCGWYWIKGNLEGGPFKSQSSAIRDAYYQFVLKRTAPTVWKDVPRKMLRTSAKSSIK
jgi:hypothetical protein